MSYLRNKILEAQAVVNDYKRIIDIMDETIDIRDSIINDLTEQVTILTGRNNDLTEQVAYWTNLYRELKNAEGETK